MQPRSVAVDTKTGCVAVVDTALHRVQVNKTKTKIIKFYSPTFLIEYGILESVSSNSDLSEALTHSFLASDWLKFGTLPQKYRFFNSVKL